jgi:hypothetical protein
MLPHWDVKHSTQEPFSCSLADESLDDTVSDLERFQQSDADTVNSNAENLGFQSSPGRSCQSEQNSVFSGTKTVTQQTGGQVHDVSNICSEFMSDSETLSNKNEELVLPSAERIALDQHTDARNANAHGPTQPRIKRDKNKSFPSRKLLQSLRDVPRLPDFPLKGKFSHVPSDATLSQSLRNVSGLKSEDSGLPTSVNCLGLRNNRRSYDHVQSKVKEYIRKPHGVPSDATLSQSLRNVSGLKSEDSGLPTSVNCLSLRNNRRSYDHAQSKDREYTRKRRDVSSGAARSHSLTNTCGLTGHSRLQRSTSCLNLTSNINSYDHAQSKVKEYIRQIKVAGEQRKCLNQGDVSNKSTQTDDVGCESDSRELEAEIWGLRREVKDRDTVISELLDKYEESLVNNAKSKNINDGLKIKLLDLSDKLAVLTKTQQSNFLRAKYFALNGTNNHTVPCCKRLCVRATDESLPSEVNDLFLNGTRGSDDKTTSHEKPRSSGGSQTLDTGETIHPDMSSTELTEESFQEEPSSKGSSDLERTSSVTQSSHMREDQHLRSAASSHHKCVCQYAGNAVTQRGETSDSAADASEFGLSQSKQRDKMPVVSEMKIPEPIRSKETLLCKKSLEHMESNNVHQNSLEKVSALCFCYTVHLPTQTSH